MWHWYIKKDYLKPYLISRYIETVENYILTVILSICPTNLDKKSTTKYQMVQCIGIPEKTQFAKLILILSLFNIVGGIHPYENYETIFERDHDLHRHELWKSIYNNSSN